MNKEIQGPEQQHLSEQLKLIHYAISSVSEVGYSLNRRVNLMRIIELESDKSPSEKLMMAAAIVGIRESKTIRGVKRVATDAYKLGAKGTPLQAIIQKEVRRQKDQLRQPPYYLGQKNYPGEMSW